MQLWLVKRQITIFTDDNITDKSQVSKEIRFDGDQKFSIASRLITDCHQKATEKLARQFSELGTALELEQCPYKSSTTGNETTVITTVCTHPINTSCVLCVLQTQDMGSPKTAATELRGPQTSGLSNTDFSCIMQTLYHPGVTANGICVHLRIPAERAVGGGDSTQENVPRKLMPLRSASEQMITTESPVMTASQWGSC